MQHFSCISEGRAIAAVAGPVFLPDEQLRLWNSFMFGTGTGLALQSGIMLAMDLFAEWRAGLYLHKLQQAGSAGL